MTLFDIANYGEAWHGKLTALMSKVDSAVPGALRMEAPHIQAKPVRKPAEWDVPSFLVVS